MNLIRTTIPSTSTFAGSEEFDLGVLSDSVEPNMKPLRTDHDLGFTPKARSLVKGLVHTLSLAKSQSICDVSDKPITPRVYRSDISDPLSKITLRKGGLYMDTVLEGEPEPKARLNSLISIMVSTIMCLAAKCPIPKSNIQATKLFLNTVVNECGETPRNIKGLLTLLKNYDGPYEVDLGKQGKCVRSPSVSPSLKIPEPVRQVTPPTHIPNPVTVPQKTPPPRCRTRAPSQPPARRNIEQKKHNWNV